MKETRCHGEAIGAQLDKDYEKKMEEIRQEASKYDIDNIYNIDKTGKYWKLKPSQGLTTFIEQHGRKKDKDRIIACLTCNAIGTYRLPIWFIGKAKTLNCFRQERLLTSLEHIGMI